MTGLTPSQPKFSPVATPIQLDGILSSYKQCLFEGVFETSRLQVWKTLAKIGSQCEQKTNVGDIVSFFGLRNNDETKFLLKPVSEIKPSEECNVITLGVGWDTKVERELKGLIPSSCLFSGADPIGDRNKDMYSEIGNFYEMAVGAKSGIFNASVMGLDGPGVYQTVALKHIDLISFLKDHVRVRSVVDYLLMDNESAEYDMLPYFLPGGSLDQNNITVCVWSVEFHATEARNEAKLADFMIRNLVAGRYLPFKLHQPGHVRGTLLNYKEEICIRRYLQNTASA